MATGHTLGRLQEESGKSQLGLAGRQEVTWLPRLSGLEVCLLSF